MDLKFSTPAGKDSSTVLKNVVNMEVLHSEIMPEQCKNFASMKIPPEKSSQKENSRMKMSQRQSYFNNTQLSPIAGEERQNHLIQTVVHHNGQQTVKERKEQCRYEFNNQTFLTSQYKESRCRSRYESVMATLLLLSAYQKTFEPPETYPQSKQKTIIRPGVAKSSTPTKFRFTTGMFKESNNSAAFIHASHLLLEMYDPHEAAIRFRDLWPQHEKRQEGLYRRAAHNWIKEIVTDNPHVFRTVVKPEQLQGLVVNPYGDRFIRFFATLSNFVMARVLAADELLNQPVLSVPTSAPDPEVFFIQMNLLHNLTLKSQVIIRKETNILGKLKILARREMRSLRKEKKELEKHVIEYRDAAYSRWISEYNQDVDIRADIVTSIVQMVTHIPIQSLYSHTSSVSPSHLSLKNAKCQCVQSLHAQLRSNPLLNKKRLWVLLRASRDKQKSIDRSIFTSYKTKNLDDIPVAIEICATNLAKATKLLSSINISARTLSSLEFSYNSVAVLRHRATTAPKLLSPAELRALKQGIVFDIRRLSFELQNVSWASCSRVTIPSLASAFHLSPIKMLDSTEITGLTPKLSSYLPLTLGIRNFAETSSIDTSQSIPRFTGDYASTIDCNLDSSGEGYGLRVFGTPVSRQESKLRDSTNKIVGTSITTRRSLETRLQLFIPNAAISEEVENNGSPSRTPPPPSVKAMVSATVLSSIHHDQDTINQCRASLQACKSFDTKFSAPEQEATSTVDEEPISNDCNISCSELEDTLGISDVTAQYAMFLDLDCSIDNV